MCVWVVLWELSKPANAGIQILALTDVLQLLRIVRETNSTIFSTREKKATTSWRLYSDVDVRIGDSLRRGCRHSRQWCSQSRGISLFAKDRLREHGATAASHARSSCYLEEPVQQSGCMG